MTSKVARIRFALAKLGCSRSARRVTCRHLYSGRHHPQLRVPFVVIATIDDDYPRSRYAASVHQIRLHPTRARFRFTSLGQSASEPAAAVKDNYALRLRFMEQLNREVVQPCHFIFTSDVAELVESRDWGERQALHKQKQQQITGSLGLPKCDHRHSTQSAIKILVSPCFAALRFDANTSFFPFGENIGKPSNVLL